MKIRSILAPLLALILALALVPAAPADEAQARDIDFGDFTITMDPSTPGKINARANGQNLASIYCAYLPEGDQKTCLAISWMASETEWGAYTPEEMLAYTDLVKEAVLKQAGGTCEISVYESSDFTPVEVDGRPGYSYILESTRKYIEDGGYGPEMSSVHKIYLIDAVEGTYCFETISDSLEKIEKYSDPLIQALRWKRAAEPAEEAPQEIEFDDFFITFPAGWKSGMVGDGVALAVSPEVGCYAVVAREAADQDYASSIGTDEGRAKLGERVAQEQQALASSAAGSSTGSTGSSQCPVFAYIGDVEAVGGIYSMTATMENGAEASLYGKILFAARSGSVYSFKFISGSEEDISEIFDPMTAAVRWK